MRERIIKIYKVEDINVGNANNLKVLIFFYKDNLIKHDACNYIACTNCYEKHIR